MCIKIVIRGYELAKKGRMRTELNTMTIRALMSSSMKKYGDKLKETMMKMRKMVVIIYIIKEKLETWASMESYLPTSDRHAASWIFSDGPSKPLGVVKLRYNALKLFFYNVAILRQRACFRQRLSLAAVSHAGRQLRNSFDVR